VTYRAVNAVVDNARVQNTAGVESETSNPDQHRSRNRKQSDESNAR